MNFSTVISEVHLGSSQTSKMLLDTERKLNVHKTFRRRPGHLLNILYTFNLRNMSMEMAFFAKI